MNTLQRIASLALLTGATLGLNACGPEYDRTEISVVSSASPYRATANLGRITVAAGSSTILRIVVWNDDDEKMPVRFNLTDPAIGEFTRQVDTDNYALLAERVGRSQLQVFADDERVLTINIEVVEQPTP